MARVHIFGDSSGYGIGAIGDDWSHLLKTEWAIRRDIGVRPRVTVSNHCSPGDMLVHVLDSGLLNSAVDCNPRGRQIGIFCVGVCESCIFRSSGENTVRRPLSDFAKDLARLTHIIDNMPEEYHFTPIFMGNTVFDDARAAHTLEGDEFSNAAAQPYADLLADYARDTGADYIDLGAEFEPDAMLADDGAHHNEIGHALTYQKISCVLQHYLLPQDSLTM